jgi:MFS family permease
LATSTEEAVARLRDVPDFRRYWAARALSSFGNLVTLIALPVLVYRLSGSAFLTALVTALEAAPYVLFGLFAGALSDRLDRKRVMVNADLVNAALAASVPLAHVLGVLTVPHVLAVALLGPAVGVFFDGANFGALPMLVGRRRIGQANSLVWGTVSVLDILVPSTAGLALAVIHPAQLLMIDAASFLASAVLVRRIGATLYDDRRARSKLSLAALLDEIREGLRFLVSHAGVRMMTIVSLLQCMAGGGFVSLMVVWCDRVLDIGTEGWRFGLVFGAWGVGGVAGSVVLARLLRGRPSLAVALRVLPLSAVLGVMAALAPTWWLAIVALLAWGSVYTMVAVTAISYRQEVTPEPLLGRVNTAGRMLSWGVGWTLGALIGGLLGHVIGVRPAMAAMAGILGVAAVVAWTSPLRRSTPVLA